MNIKHFQYLIEIERVRSISQAAEKRSLFLFLPFHLFLVHLFFYPDQPLLLLLLLLPQFLLRFRLLP